MKNSLRSNPYLGLCLILGGMPINALAGAGPEGGNVVSGQATITHGDALTTINQSSDRAIINWQDF